MVMMWSCEVLQSYGFEVYTDNKLVVGRACLLPQQLSNLEGTLTLTLCDVDFLPVGTISGCYIRKLSYVTIFSSGLHCGDALCFTGYLFYW